MPLLKQYESEILKKSDVNQDAGLEKTASTDTTETAFVIPSSTRVGGNANSLVNQIQNLMTLNSKNAEYERMVNDKGNLDLLR